MTDGLTAPAEQVLGQTINLKAVVTAGAPGVVLGVTVLIVTGFVCIIADRLFGGSGVAGAAALPLRYR